jgi:hypothetical protein
VPQGRGYRQEKPTPVAAVCDRRPPRPPKSARPAKKIPALTARRYKISKKMILSSMILSNLRPRSPVESSGYSTGPPSYRSPVEGEAYSTGLLSPAAKRLLSPPLSVLGREAVSPPSFARGIFWLFHRTALLSFARGGRSLLHWADLLSFARGVFRLLHRAPSSVIGREAAPLSAFQISTFSF